MATIAEKLTAIASAKEAIKVAIEGKGVEVANAPLSEYPAKIEAIESGGGNTPQPAIKWTGHADAEGLRAIGWDEEDIAYYQEHGVNWNEEDDELHKVSEDNKALYGVLTKDNISTYASRIVYLPKIDTSKATSLRSMCISCHSLVSIPKLNTSRATSFADMFSNCYSLVSIPQLNTSKATNFSNMFNSCHSLVSIPQLDTSKAIFLNFMFYNCHSLVSIPQLDTSSGETLQSMFCNCYSLVSIPQLDTSSAAYITDMFSNCYSLVSIPQLDTSKAADLSGVFSNCYSLVWNMTKGVSVKFSLSNSELINHTSLMYIINNAKDLTGGTTQTLTLGSDNLAKLTDDEKAIIIAKNWTLA